MSKHKATAQLVSAGFGNNERWSVIVRLANGTYTSTYRCQDGWSSLRIKDIPKFLHSQIDELWLEADKRNNELRAEQEAKREELRRLDLERKKYVYNMVEFIYQEISDRLDPGTIHTDVLPLELPEDLLTNIVNDQFYKLEDMKREAEKQARNEVLFNVFKDLIVGLYDYTSENEERDDTGLARYVIDNVGEEYMGSISYRQLSDGIQKEQDDKLREHELALLARWNGVVA